MTWLIIPGIIVPICVYALLTANQKEAPKPELDDIEAFNRWVDKREAELTDRLNDEVNK